MTDGGSAPTGFEPLSHPCRLRILAALGEQLRERPSEPSVGFSDLRRRVGMRDSGNFNYHLDRLAGRFVREADGGYRLTVLGLRIVAAVVSGRYDGGEPMGPRPLGDDCPVCGEELAVRYEGGLLRVSCADGHEFTNSLPRESVEGRDIDRVVDVFVQRTRRDMELASAGVCPMCDGSLDWSVGPPFDDDFPHFSTRCTRCGALFDLPVLVPLLAEPEVIAFYHERGIDVRRRAPWASMFYRDVRVEARADPVRVTVVVDVRGDALTGTIDDSLTVRDVDLG